MNPMIPSLNSDGEKMSCSDVNSKIDLLDSEKIIKKKINKAFCEEGNIDCGLIKFMDMVLFPILNIKEELFIIERSEQYGGNITYQSFKILEKDFKEKKLHPIDLKSGISQWLIEFLKPLRDKFNDSNMEEILSKAY